jgi:transmembrane 9 superfamily protein 2/4
MVLISVFFAAIGFVSPDKRNSIVTLMVLIFVFMGGFAGYSSSRMYKMFGGTEWLRNALMTSLLYPMIAFSTFFIINIFLHLEESSGAVPFSTIVTLLILWICCSSPLVLIGSFIAFKRRTLKNPGSINVVPKTIPPQPFYLSTKVLCLVTGIIPFM